MQSAGLRGLSDYLDRLHYRPVQTTGLQDYVDYRPTELCRLLDYVDYRTTWITGLHGLPDYPDAHAKANGSTTATTTVRCPSVVKCFATIGSSEATLDSLSLKVKVMHDHCSHTKAHIVNQGQGCISKAWSCVMVIDKCQCHGTEGQGRSVAHLCSRL